MQLILKKINKNLLKILSTFLLTRFDKLLKIFSIINVIKPNIVVIKKRG